MGRRDISGDLIGFKGAPGVSGTLQEVSNCTKNAAHISEVMNGHVAMWNERVRIRP